MLSCELRDTAGARVGRRPRLSNMPATVDALSAATLVTPGAGGSTLGEGFDVEFTNVVPDSAGEPGIYRVTLVGSNGRAWRVYVADPDDSSPNGRVRVPDIASFGGNGLPDGAIDCTIAAFAWPTFDSASFLWTDLPREYDLFSESAPVQFTKP
jgi:hypothetical protein